MHKSLPTLEKIEQDLASHDLRRQSEAIRDLLAQVRKDPRIHERAFDIFLRLIETASNPVVLVGAVRGIEQISGPDAARPTWIALLNHSRPETIVSVVYAIADHAYATILIEMLNTRQEPIIQNALMRSLGKMRDSRAFAPIVERLAKPALRPQAVNALADLGDSRAIPHLEPLLNDTTECEYDDRGFMLTAAHIANDAIRRLRLSPGKDNCVTAPGLLYLDQLR